jgi:hypothetical protein
MRRGHLTKEHGGAVEYLQGLQYQIINQINDSQLILIH